MQKAPKTIFRKSKKDLKTVSSLILIKRNILTYENLQKKNWFAVDSMIYNQIWKKLK